VVKKGIVGQKKIFLVRKGIVGQKKDIFAQKRFCHF